MGAVEATARPPSGQAAALAAADPSLARQRREAAPEEEPLLEGALAQWARETASRLWARAPAPLRWEERAAAQGALPLAGEQSESEAGAV